LITHNLYWSLNSPVTLASNKIVGVSSPYNHIGLFPATTYYYAVTEVDGIESGLSNEMSATTFGGSGGSGGSDANRGNRKSGGGSSGANRKYEGESLLAMYVILKEQGL
jgi:hypothetical protein